jgi:acyl-CoA synthetase (AMP-forming)/AMP-acid ligase II
MLFTVGDFLGIDYPALLADETLPALEASVLMDRNWDEFIARGDKIEPGRIEASLAALSADGLSDIIFTSGTTGAPKGVLMTYARVIPQVGVWIGNTGLREGERYLIANPFFHSFGLKVGWVACLIAGAVIVPMAQFDAKQAARMIEELQIAFLPGPPTIFQMLLDEQQARPFDCSSLRGGTTGAATVPPVLVQRTIAELGLRDIVTAYGMTECVNITSCRPGDSIERIATTCGAAIPGNEVMIAGDDGRELPRGETGEIRVRGQGVMLGYLDDPQATAEAIDPDGWLHTGDIGTMDADGYVRITDRKKDMFIAGGFNCYPAEIEKLLAEHPSVSMSAVIGVPDERMGEVGKAFVVLRPGASAREAELIAWSRANMANYKVPRSFVVVDELPRNASGKVLKTELR